LVRHDVRSSRGDVTHAAPPRRRGHFRPDGPTACRVHGTPSRGRSGPSRCPTGRCPVGRDASDGKGARCFPQHACRLHDGRGHRFGREPTTVRHVAVAAGRPRVQRRDSPIDRDQPVGHVPVACLTGTGRTRQSDGRIWSERRDSNPRPLAPHASALPGCATLRPGPHPSIPAATRRTIRRAGGRSNRASRALSSHAPGSAAGVQADSGEDAVIPGRIDAGRHCLMRLRARQERTQALQFDEEGAQFAGQLRGQGRRERSRRRHGRLRYGRGTDHW
jgi:hypothetical protein